MFCACCLEAATPLQCRSPHRSSLGCALPCRLGRADSLPDIQIDPQEDEDLDLSKDEDEPVEAKKSGPAVLLSSFITEADKRNQQIELQTKADAESARLAAALAAAAAKPAGPPAK
jgi:hypothetical protein